MCPSGLLGGVIRERRRLKRDRDEVAEPSFSDGRKFARAEQLHRFGLLGRQQQHAFAKPFVESRRELIALIRLHVKDRHSRITGRRDEQQLKQRIACQQQRLIVHRHVDQSVIGGHHDASALAQRFAQPRSSLSICEMSNGICG